MAEKIKKKDQQKVERWIKRNIKNPVLSFILIVALTAGVYFYNEVYIYQKETAEKVVFRDSEVRCVDGDTFAYGDRKIRLLAVDTPESVKPNHPVEPYGEEASEYTCQLLKNADNIEFKKDKGNEVDKYGRDLAWVYLDGELLQKLLIENGYAEIKYVQKSTVDKSILKELEKAQEKAKTEKIRIWSLD